MTSWIDIAAAGLGVFLASDLLLVFAVRAVFRLWPPEGWRPSPLPFRPLELDLFTQVPRAIKQLAGCSLAGVALATRAAYPPFWASTLTWVKLVGPLLSVLVVREAWRTYRWSRPELSAVATGQPYERPTRPSSAATMETAMLVLAVMVGTVWTFSGGGALPPMPRLVPP